MGLQALMCGDGHARPHACFPSQTYVPQKKKAPTFTKRSKQTNLNGTQPPSQREGPCGCNPLLKERGLHSLKKHRALLWQGAGV